GAISVAASFVVSMAHPGGNLTGLVGFIDSPAKQTELFKELHPGLRRLLVFIDRQDPTAPRELAEIRTAAAALGVQLLRADATEEADVERIVGSASPARRGGRDHRGL